MVTEKAVDGCAWNESTWHVDEVDCGKWRQVVYPHGGGPCCGAGERERRAGTGDRGMLEGCGTLDERLRRNDRNSVEFWRMARVVELLENVLHPRFEVGS